MSIALCVDNPGVVRASDDTREHTVGMLRQGLLAGRLGPDTFVERVEAAYRAKTSGELAAVTNDLPRERSSLQRVLARLARVTPAAATPLRPPTMSEGECRVLGRAVSCDYAIADMSVSSRHAELARTAVGWLIRDLNSRNGTRVNGWLVKEQMLNEGDTIELGATVFVFHPAPESPHTETGV